MSYHYAPLASGRRADETAPLQFRIADVTSRISGMSPLIRADLQALLRPFVLNDKRAAVEKPQLEIELRRTTDSAVWETLIGGKELFHSGLHDRLLGRLEWLVVARSIAQMRSRIVWHAASLAWGRRAVTLVAQSGAGKSTLTVGLALRGWRPLADDLTVIDPVTHTIDPFRRCFHLGPAAVKLAAGADLLTWPTPSLTDYTRPRLWGRAGRLPTWIVLVRRDPDRPASLTPISQAEAAGALYAATIRNHAAAASARVAAHVAGAAAGCWELNNSDLGETLDLLMTTLLGAPTRTLSWQSETSRQR